MLQVTATLASVLGYLTAFGLGALVAVVLVAARGQRCEDVARRVLVVDRPAGSDRPAPRLAESVHGRAAETAETAEVEGCTDGS